MAPSAKPARRPAARHQGLSLIARTRHTTRAWASFRHRAPRHLFDRGPGRADPRPEEPNREAGSASSSCRSRRRHDRRSVAKAHATSCWSALRRRHGASPQTSITHAGPAVGTRLAETHQTLVPEQPAQPHRGRNRRPVEDRARRRSRAHARRRGVWLRDGAAGGDRLHHDARLPPEHLPRGHRHAGSAAAREVQGQARARRELHALIAEELREIMAASSASARSRRWSAASTSSSRARPSSTGRRRASTFFTNLALFAGSWIRTGVATCPDAQEHGIDRSLDVTVLLDLCKPRSSAGEEVVANCRSQRQSRRGTITGSEITRKHGAQGLPRTRSAALPRSAARASARSFRRLVAVARGRRERLRRQGVIGRQDRSFPAARGDLPGQ